MEFLIDTNILLRAIQVEHPQYQISVQALERLKARGDGLDIVPQILYELWVVCTRPEGPNGLGLTAEEGLHELQRAQSLFPMLPDAPEIYPEWERLVLSHAVLGKQAHDARLAAAMRVYGLTNILTFNGGHFMRYPGIVGVNPVEIAEELAT